MKKLPAFLLITVLALATSGCLSTAVGVAGSAVKGTVKVGAGVAKTGGKAVGAVLSSDSKKDESEDE